MEKYACDVNQSEMGKYFKLILIRNILVKLYKTPLGHIFKYR